MATLEEIYIILLLLGNIQLLHNKFKDFQHHIRLVRAIGVR